MTFQDLWSFRRYRGLKSEVVVDVHATVDLFGKKDPLWANFQKCFPKGFTNSQIHVLCANFVKFGWPEIGKVVRYLPDKKFGSRCRSRFCVDRAQNLPGQFQRIHSECPKFHPNPFTSGGVIAELVNVVEMRHKVFPILGEATASPPSNNKQNITLTRSVGQHPTWWPPWQI